MKPYALLAALLLLLFGCENKTVVISGNTAQEAINFQKGGVRCSECQMVIEDYPYTAQLVTPEGKTYFFSDVGSFVKWQQGKDFKGNEKVWVWALDTKRWINAKAAFYTTNEITPMEYGFGAYENQTETMIDFDTMKMKMLRGENLTNPAYRKKVLGE